MTNILILNGGKNFAHSHGKLNDTMTQAAKAHLLDLGHQVPLPLPTLSSSLRVLAWMGCILPLTKPINS